MALIVIFQQPAAVGHVSANAIGNARIRESIALNGTTTASAEAGEVAIIMNTESTTIYVAHGTTPDAAASESTLDTTAGYPVPPDMETMVKVKEGDKFSAKAIA